VQYGRFLKADSKISKGGNPTVREGARGAILTPSLTVGFLLCLSAETGKLQNAAFDKMTSGWLGFAFPVVVESTLNHCNAQSMTPTKLIIPVRQSRSPVSPLSSYLI
jgi:hypothetical protein